MRFSDRPMLAQVIPPYLLPQATPSFKFETLILIKVTETERVIYENTRELVVIGDPYIYFDLEHALLMSSS